MKKVLLVLLLLAFMAPSAHAQGGSYLGMYADESGTTCDADANAYAYAYIYFKATLDAAFFPNLSAVQFSISNWPEASSDLLITPTWDSPLVINDGIGVGVSIAFPLPYPEGPVVNIGSIQFFVLDEGAIGENVEMTFVPGEIAGAPAPVVMVDGTDFTTYDVPGNFFTWNCSGGCECVIPSTAVEDANWSSIKALY